VARDGDGRAVRTRAAVRVAAVVGLILAWTAAQFVWLGTDDRIVDGDELGNVGAVELFWGQTHQAGVFQALRSAYVEDFGEYPALYPAVVGAASARAGVTDLDGDGPAKGARVLWAGLTAAATAAMAAALALRGGGAVGSTTVAATVLLLCSPLWSALQRHVMLENGLAAGVAGAGAAICWARVMEDQAAPRRARALWIAAGVAAGAALLIKQTAVLALVPLAVGVWILPGPRRGWGPALAAAAALAVAGPWYVDRIGREGGYLLRSAEANPDAVGLLHQLVYYPLVLVQEAWAPLLVLVCVAIAHRERGRGRPEGVGFTAAVVVLGVAALVLIPKKYARLLVPLLPFAAVGGALIASRWRPWLRRGAGLLAAAVWGLTTFVSLPPGVPLGATAVGLRDLDERCTQQWIQAPDPTGVPWIGLLLAIESAGGRDAPIRVGALRWPVPPCAHQTTHDLGEHLRIRARRAELEAWIGAGEGWSAEEGWTDRAPALLLTEGLVDPAAYRAACGRAPAPPTTVVRSDGGWDVELAMYPCARGDTE